MNQDRIVNLIGPEHVTLILSGDEGQVQAEFNGPYHLGGTELRVGTGSGGRCPAMTLYTRDADLLLKLIAVTRAHFEKHTLIVKAKGNKP